MAEIKYESHITCDIKDAVKALEVAEEWDWRFSAIDGDPVMGKQAYCYLTAYDSDLENINNRMEIVGGRLVEFGVTPLRFKIEMIVFDTRTNVDLFDLKDGCKRPWIKIERLWAHD